MHEIDRSTGCAAAEESRAGAFEDFDALDAVE
jgi:hypothetical protein